MPDIKSVIRQMMADGESEDVIDAVVKKMQGGSEIKSGLPDMSPELVTPPRDEYTGPDTFWGGVKNSLFGKEFDDTARKSLKGFAKGTADLGATFADTAQGVASGVHSLIEDPAAHFRAMPEAFRQMGRGIRDVTMNAGADPEAFGHMSGQLFGQPAFTEGLIKAPAIAKATTGAINRVPIVNKTFSNVGKALEGTRDPKILPASRGGLIAGAVRGAARPIGRALSRVGERGRLDAGTRPPSSRTNIKLKGETESPHSPDSDIFAGGGQGATRPRPVRHDTPDMSRNSEFTRPILETAEELAARGRPQIPLTGGQSSRFRSRPFEPRPVDTTPYPRPGAIPEGIPGEAPLVRDTTPYPRPGDIPEGIPGEAPIVRDTTPYEPPPVRPEGIPPELPPEPTPNPIPVGEGGLSSRYQYDPFEFGQPAIGELGLPRAPKTKTPPPAAPPAPKFEPAIDPAATSLTPEDIALMKSRRAELKAALQKMAGGESVDTTTGEIIPRTKGVWRQSEPDVNTSEFDLGPDEPGIEFGPNDPSIANDAGRFADDVEATRYPGDEAYDLGEISPGFRSSQSMPDWGPAPQRTIQPEEWGDWGPDADIPTLVPDASGSHVAAPRPGVNPLRPEVPPGQVTNRSMFQNSEMRGAPQQTPGRQFAEQVLPHEFDQDMLLTPAEQAQPDIPPMQSPVENQFDPRISNLAPNEEMGFSGPENIIDTANDVGRSPELQAKIVKEGIDEMGMDRLPNAYHYWARRDPELASYMFNERIAPILDRVPADQFPQLINHFERTGNPELADYIHQRAVRPPEPIAAPSGRDVRWDAETESLFDRNSQNWDDVTDATPEEIARAKGINKGTIEDPTGGRTNFSPLDLTERGKRGKGQDRLNSLFGEDTGQRLSSEESPFGPSDTRALRQSGKKRLDKTTQARWTAWGDELLKSIPDEPGKVGLEVEAPTNIEGPGRQSTRMTYRDANGKAVGVLETDRTGSGVANFAVSSKLNMGRGKVMFKMLKEAIDRGIAKPSGETSNMSKNMIERLNRLVDDAKANANDEGMFGDSELELEINKILDGESPEGFSTGANEEMGFSGERTPGIADDLIGRKRLEDKLSRLGEESLRRELTPEEKNTWRELQYELFPETRDIDPFNDEIANPFEEYEQPNLQPQLERPSRIHGETSQFEKPEWFNVDDDFGIANDEGIPAPGRLVKKGEPKNRSVIPEGFEKVGGRQIGPKGASYRISDPNNKHLGDINVTPRDIAAHKAANEDLALVYDDGEIAEMLYQERKAELLSKHGYYPDEPKIKVEPKTTRTKDVQVPAEPKEPTVTKLAPAGEAQMMGAEPTYSEAPTTVAKPKVERKPKPKPVTKTKIPFEPNVAFGRGGDLKPIIQELARLQRTNADDIKYAELLPDDLLDGPLEPGQTYRQKLQDAIKVIDDQDSSFIRRDSDKESADWNERQQVLADLRNKLKIGELDDFVNRVIEMSRLDPKPIHGPLDPSKVDVTKLRPGKLNQGSAKLWQSPKMQQQQNALFRERMGKPPKKAKDKKKAKWL